MIATLSPTAVAVLRQLVLSESVTKPALQQILGISDATAFRSVEELSNLGIITHSAADTNTRGRPAILLNIKKSSFTSIAVTVEEDETAVSLVDATGEILSTSIVPINSRNEYTDAIKEMAQVISLMRARAFEIAPLLCGVGVSFGGSVDAKTGTLLRPSRFSLWHHRQLAHDLTLATGIRTRVDNDVSSLARTLLWYGNRANLENLLLVNCSRGIGLAICINGQILMGQGNIPAGLAHTASKINELPGQQCECGRFSCLELLHSLNALKNKLAVAKTVNDSEALETISVSSSGPQLLKDSGEAIAINTLELARCLDIGLIVLTGPMKNSPYFRDSFMDTISKDKNNSRAHQSALLWEELLPHSHPATLAAATISLDEVFQQRSFLQA